MTGGPGGEGAGPLGGDPREPWFSVTMTVYNNAATISVAVRAILDQLGDGGELVIVDSRSTDGTAELLATVQRDDPRLRLFSAASLRGVGRNLAVGHSRSSIVLTQVDGDNRYAPGALRAAAQYVRDHPRIDVVWAVGASDRDPSVSRFYAWRRAAFDRAGGYPAVQERDDPPLLLGSFRAGLRIHRLLLPAVAEDMKPRHSQDAPSVAPWSRSGHARRAARRFRVMGFRFPEYLRLLWLTRRTAPRFLAGVAVAAGAYLQGWVAGDDATLLDRYEAYRRPDTPTGRTEIPPSPPGTGGSQ